MTPQDVNPDAVTPGELMTIGAFAQQSGLTASALRFYADSALLAPAEVDAASGYRLYDPSQLERAILLRRLRAINMPLRAVDEVLAAGPDDAVRLVEEHVAAVAGDAASAKRQAAVILASLAGEPRPTASLSGPVLAAAIDQVLTATTLEPGLAVLNGVRVELAPEAVTLTATDRYRLATRTLAPIEPISLTWAETVDADDLRACLPWLRRSPRGSIAVTGNGLWIGGSESRRCRLLAEPFPDYRLMLDALPPVLTRVAIEKTLLLRALEANSSSVVSVRVRGGEIGLRGEAPDEVRAPATVTGPDIDLAFEMTTLYPAVSSAIGADLLLDLRGPDLPATIRSADNGDLTTLAMPTRNG